MGVEVLYRGVVLIRENTVSVDESVIAIPKQPR